MKIKPISLKLLLYIIFLQNVVLGQNVIGNVKLVEKIKFVGHPVYNPFQMDIYKNHILIHDHGSDEMILHFDIKGRFVNSFGKQGQGPGELEKAPKFSGIKKRQLFLTTWKKLHVFEYTTGNFINSTTIRKAYAKPIRVFNNMLLVWAGIDEDVFIKGYPLRSNYSIEQSDSINFGNYNIDKELSSCRLNPLLKDGFSYNDKDENIYFSFINGSLIIGFDRNGDTIFKTTEPHNIVIPEFISRPGADFSAPPRDKYPAVTISINGDNKFIYTIHSGAVFKSFSEFLLKKSSLSQSKILNIYNKKTSEFLGSYQLPFPVRGIVATEDFIYALTVDPEIALLKLKKPID